MLEPLDQPQALRRVLSGCRGWVPRGRVTLLSNGRGPAFRPVGDTMLSTALRGPLLSCGTQSLIPEYPPPYYFRTRWTAPVVPP